MCGKCHTASIANGFFQGVNALAIRVQAVHQMHDEVEKI
jgi:hypothetical protein